MKTQTHHKQITLLVLSMVLSMVSCWIPLPPGPQMPSPRLPEAAAQSAPAKPALSGREPATAGRFAVTARTPQNVNRPDSATTPPDDSAKPMKRLITLPELSSDERNRLNSSKFMPVTDQDRNFKH